MKIEKDGNGNVAQASGLLAKKLRQQAGGLRHVKK
jgi:hypothetical protein